MLIQQLDELALQELHAGQQVQSGAFTVAHTGNALQEVHVTAGPATLTLSLLKGGAIVSARLRGAELFDLDRDYLDLDKLNRTKGNPNIFPVFNQMPEGVKMMGAQDVLPNHGLARIKPWRAYTVTAEPWGLVLRLQSDASTQLMFPHVFTYTQLIVLRETALEIQQRIDTDGPFSVGFHPYFRVSNKREIDIEGIEAGTPYWYLPNRLSKAEKDEIIAQGRSEHYLSGREGSLNFAAREVNHHFDLSQQHSRVVTLTDPGLQRRIRIASSSAYQGLTVWCEADAETSVCIEPVTDRSGRVSPKSSPWYGWVRYEVGRF